MSSAWLYGEQLKDTGAAGGTMGASSPEESDSGTRKDVVAGYGLQEQPYGRLLVQFEILT